MKNRTIFLDAVRDGLLIGDGPIISELQKRHTISDNSIELLNILLPDAVSSLHAEYIAAGSRLIETNTHTANRFCLAKTNNESKLNDIITAGVVLAKRNAHSDTYISGSVAPLPGIDVEMLSHTDRMACYLEQVSIILEAGVDLLSFKTFSDLSELTTVIQMVRAISDIPIAAHMTFERSGLAADGTNALEMAESCINAGASVVGANCGYGAQSVLHAISKISVLGVPSSAYMNAGFPEWIDGKLIYSSTPKYIAELALELAGKGAHIIGGCCGTNPEVIQSITSAINDKYNTPHARVKFLNTYDYTHNQSSNIQKNTEASSRVIVQLDPPDSPDQTPVIDAALKLREAGINRVSISDNCLAEVRSDALTTASIVARSTGMDITLHMTCRDRNRLAIQSTIIGAQALGIKSLLCVTGVPISMCQETNTSGVFDLNSISLIRLVSECNAGKHGPNLQTSFEIGAALNPNVRNLDGQIDKLKRKVDSGASFVFTQPLFSKDRADRLREALDRSGIKIPVYMGIMPLTSTRNAEYVHNEVPGIYVPDKVRDYLNKYDRVLDQRAAMTELLLSLIDGVYPSFSEFFLIAPRNNVELVLPMVSQTFSLIGRESD
ncbi:MAG: bifunctional homocysteine S-methyltransferase/methylenetetrahydrofolate reductase [Armatimonadota bacterium]